MRYFVGGFLVGVVILLIVGSCGATLEVTSCDPPQYQFFACTPSVTANELEIVIEDKDATIVGASVPAGQYSVVFTPASAVFTFPEISKTDESGCTPTVALTPDKFGLEIESPDSTIAVLEVWIHNGAPAAFVHGVLDCSVQTPVEGISWGKIRALYRE